MVEKVEFAKLSGSGNDFICVDNRQGRFDPVLAESTKIAHFSRSLCHRGTGIGADGIIFACQPEIEEVADIAARFFEADGSEAELCGNGTACFLHWATANGWVHQSETRILTPAGVVRGQNGDGRYVRVCIPLPEDMQMDRKIRVGQREWNCDFVVTGVPHVVVYVDDVESVDMPHWGPAFRHHQEFQPRGVNANFVQVLAEGELAIRTWEFGVEGETLSCGTGSAAAAILAARRFNWPTSLRSSEEPVRIRSRSGDILKVYFTEAEDGTVCDVCLETIVRFIYFGTAHDSLIVEALCPPER